MIKVKFAAVVTAAITAMSIGSAQARPLPQTGVAISTSQIKSNEALPPINPFRVTNAATIQLAAGRARVLSEPTPPPFGSPPSASFMRMRVILSRGTMMMAPSFLSS